MQQKNKHMKILNLLFILSLFISCNKIDNEVNPNIVRSCYSNEILVNDDGYFEITDSLNIGSNLLLNKNISNFINYNKLCQQSDSNQHYYSYNLLPNNGDTLMDIYFLLFSKENFNKKMGIFDQVVHTTDLYNNAKIVGTNRTFIVNNNNIVIRLDSINWNITLRILTFDKKEKYFKAFVNNIKDTIVFYKQERSTDWTGWKQWVFIDEHPRCYNDCYNKNLIFENPITFNDIKYLK